MFDEDVIIQIQEAARLIQSASYVVGFTGAGASTDSGIPDFRSPDSGLWQNADPMTVASIYGFRHNPQGFYDWVRPLSDVTINAEPNPAHHALMDLERMGYLKSIVTQNIDMLHSRVGHKTIYELHGHMRTATCIHCFEKYDGEAILTDFLETGNVPYCDECKRGVLKPDVILFGEQLPIRELQGAQKEARLCDLMIIIGSSLEVAPASDIPILARRTGAKLIIVNLEQTPVDSMAEVVINERAAHILPEIIRQIET
jgi:NAD-dependent deacetylase